MDHKAFLNSLSPEQRQNLTITSNAKGIAHLLAHSGAIAICTYFILSGAPFWPIAMLVQGILLIFLFTLLHETTHKTPFASDWLNIVVGHLCGLTLVLPAIWFRYFHLAHHKYTQDPEKDPELASPKPETWPQFILHISGLPVWSGQIKALIRNAIWITPMHYVPAKGRTKVRNEARAYITVYAILMAISAATGSTALLYVWIIPIILGQPFLRLYLLAEHGRCAFVADMFENTRTTYTNRLMRWLAWNMPYHSEHHTYPSVPFHKLPELHGLMEHHLKVTSNSYCEFNRDYITRALD